MSNGYQQYFKKAKQVREGGPASAKKFAINTKSKNNNKSSQLNHDELIKKVFQENARKRRSLKSKKPKTPWRLIGALTVCTIVTGLGALYPHEISNFLGKIEVGFLSEGRAQAATKAENKSQTKVEKKANSAASDEVKTAANAAGGKNWTEKDMSYFSKLRDRKQQLDAREQELAKLEDELHKQKLEIEKRIEELQRIRNQISGVLKDKVEIDQQKVDKLVEFYSNMKPQQAAKVIANIDEDLAVEILGKMKKKNAANIMNLLKPQKAQMLSEKFAGYKRR